MIYEYLAWRLYTVKTFMFIVSNVIPLMLSMFIPIKLIFKKTIAFKHIVFCSVAISFFFFIYCIYLERYFGWFLIINIYQVILSVVIVFSVFNFLLYDKNMRFQVVLLSLGLFMTIWINFCTIAFMGISNYIGNLSLFKFELCILSGGILYYLIYTVFFERRQVKKWLLYTYASCYLGYFLVVNVVNIVAITFSDGQLRIVVSENFVPKQFIEALVGSSVWSYQDFSRAIYLVILFMIIASIPLLFMLHLAVKADKNKQSLKEQQLRETELKKYVTQVEAVNYDFKKRNHDINNVFSTLSGYLNNQEAMADPLRDYFENIQEDFSLIKQSGCPNLQIQNIEDQELLSLLLHKLSKASQLNTILKTEVSVPVQIPRSELLHVVRILGILIDNALEESAKIEDGKTQIAFLRVNPCVTLVRIRNTHSNPQFLSQYLSGKLKSEKGTERAMGLTIVNELIRKRKHLDLECKQNEEIVEFSLLITNIEGSDKNSKNLYLRR